ncbi:OmpH family outer membrane protein [Motilimonas pumila]|uniref:Molecular chaperone n=1 Tax=Motilimonas pumila TaxID=2303987 RepID=A0A418YGT0_9GAMM|nr:OmpH family outer membrane protein [Motilimonas pumila]RJG49071.1 molecular chaperone [Motilimonas pumila]
MKKLFKAASLSLALIAGSFSSVAMAADKIAVVFPNEIFQQMPQKDQIINKLKKEFQPRINEMKSLEKKIKSKQEKEKRDGALMSDKDKTKLSREIQSLVADYQLKLKAFEEDNRRRQAEEQNKMREKVVKAIEAIAKREGYDLVVNGEAAVFAKPSLNISDKVVAEIGKRK